MTRLGKEDAYRLGRPARTEAPGPSRCGRSPAVAATSRCSPACSSGPVSGRPDLADPGLLAALLGLVEPTHRGDPKSPLCWTTLSTRRLAAEMTAAGHKVCPDPVAKLLSDQGFSLQANAKTIEGGQHLDRDAQFSYLNVRAGEHLGAGDPVISVDTKKKELIGRYKNGGAEWRPGGDPEPVPNP